MPFLRLEGLVQSRLLLFGLSELVCNSASRMYLSIGVSSVHLNAKQYTTKQLPETAVDS